MFNHNSYIRNNCRKNTLFFSLYMMETKVINLFGGPGVGKSTTMAGIFQKLKILGYECEMAPEYAKEKVWEQAEFTMEDQIYIFAKQLHKIWRLSGKVEYIICDSPLLNSIIYDKRKNPYFRDLVVDQFKSYRNINFFIKRGTKYIENGRQQNEEEAKEIDEMLLQLFEIYGIDFQEIQINNLNSPSLTDKIVDYVTGKITKSFDENIK